MKTSRSNLQSNNTENLMKKAMVDIDEHLKTN